MESFLSATVLGLIGVDRLSLIRGTAELLEEKNVSKRLS